MWTKEKNCSLPPSYQNTSHLFSNLASSKRNPHVLIHKPCYSSQQPRSCRDFNLCSRPPSLSPQGWHRDTVTALLLPLSSGSNPKCRYCRAVPASQGMLTDTQDGAQKQNCRTDTNPFRSQLQTHFRSDLHILYNQPACQPWLVLHLFIPFTFSGLKSPCTLFILPYLLLEKLQAIKSLQLLQLDLQEHVPVFHQKSESRSFHIQTPKLHRNCYYAIHIWELCTY